MSGTQKFYENFCQKFYQNFWAGHDAEGAA